MKVDVAELGDASVTVIVCEPGVSPEGRENVYAEGNAPDQLVVTAAGVVVSGGRALEFHSYCR